MRKSGIILKVLNVKVTSKCLRIRLPKAYHPMCLENTQSTWIYGIAYDFRTIKGPKVNESVSEQRRVL
jgi:hypothetical protein